MREGWVFSSEEEDNHEGGGGRGGRGWIESRILFFLIFGEGKIDLQWKFSTASKMSLGV